MEKIRGFEVVDKEHRTAYDVFTDEKGRKHNFEKKIILPRRADNASSGYDFYLNKEVTFLPGVLEKIKTDVKAYMMEDEELLLFIRSSLALKHGLELVNAVGKIDSSYYSNPDNDGNIIVAIKNTSGKSITIKEGERIVQGTFYKYLITDNDEPINKERTGGVGSTGK